MPPSRDIAAAAVPASGPDLTVVGARRALALKLRGCGIESPEVDARILIGHALGLDHGGLAAAQTRRVSVAEQEAIAILGNRRATREPIARILGQKEFWSLPLAIDGTTLVPRPETETVVEAALAVVDAKGARAQALRLADLGTGCGALLLSLLSELPNAFGVGTDISTGAVRVAQNNARHLGLTRAAFVACDLATALHGPFDLIVANPPYIATGEIAALAPEVRDFEPHRALDGGSDGLDAYRKIAATAPALLAGDGALVVELGAGQAERVVALFAAAGLAPLSARPDLNGLVRALVVTGHVHGALDPGKKALGMSSGTD